MRALIISTILFTAVLTAIALNSGFIKKSTDTIILYTSEEEYQKAPKEALERLESFWEENKIFLEFSVGYKEIDKMSELILELRHLTEANDKLGTMRVCSLVSNCASNIARLERLSVENLL